jgi:hypothetical protein
LLGKKGYVVVVVVVVFGQGKCTSFKVQLVIWTVGQENQLFRWKKGMHIILLSFTVDLLIWTSRMCFVAVEKIAWKIYNMKFQLLSGK